MRLGATLLAAALAVGCSSGSGSKADGPVAPAPSRKVVATVEGTFDGRSLTLRPAAAAVGAGLVEVPAVQDGTPGSNPPDTLEMVTESIAFPVADGCGPGVFSLDASTTVRSFFPHAVLSNVYFEITWMSLTGREACNSEGVAPEGTSNQFGLFAYGMLDRSGTGYNAATAPWRLRLPDQSPFTFRGRIVADVQSDTTPPTTVNMPASGRYADWFPFQAECVDDLTGWGCAGIYYTLDGTTPTTASTWYSGPFMITGDTTVKILSVDMFGNEEPYQTLTFVIDTEPPTVLSTTPAPWSVAADGAATITVTFSEPIQPDGATVTLRDLNGYYYPSQIPDGASFSYTPTIPFPPGTVLQVLVADAVDLVGRLLEAPFSTYVAVGGTPALEAPQDGFEALDVTAAVCNRGDALATWMEDRVGGRMTVVARANGDTWSPPEVEPSPWLPQSGSRALASNNAVWRVRAQLDPIGGDWHLSADPSANGVPFDAPLLGEPELATAGSPDRAVIAWADGAVIAATSWDGYAWSTIQPLFDSPSGFFPVHPSAATGGAGDLVAWRREDGSPGVKVLTGSVPAATFPIWLEATEGPAVAVGDGVRLGAAIAWHLEGRIHAATVAPFSTWSAPAALTPVGTTCASPQLASDGGSFLAVFLCGNDLHASRFDGTAWSSPFLVATDPLASSLAGAPSGYRVGAVLGDAGVAHAFQIRITGTSASAPERIDAEPGAVRPRIQLNADVGFFCAGWSQVVDEPLAAQARARCFL